MESILAHLRTSIFSWNYLNHYVLIQLHQIAYITYCTAADDETQLFSQKKRLLGRKKIPTSYFRLIQDY